MIGTQVGIGAQEVNALLNHAGLIDGQPGAWSLTEKGAQYAAEKLHERGTGGYSSMNPSWTVTTWDESVLGVLDLSDEAKQWAREAVADRRRAMAVARKAATAAAELSRLGTADAPRVAQRLRVPGRGAGATAAAAVVGFAAAYGLYKARNRQPR